MVNIPIGDVPTYEANGLIAPVTSKKRFSNSGREASIFAKWTLNLGQQSVEYGVKFGYPKWSSLMYLYL